MIRVLVADDFPLVREAIVAALGCADDIEVVGTAADGADALAKARELRPDVVVLDVRMPGMSGLTALNHLTAELPDTRVLLLTASAERDVVIDAVSSGAAGYLTKRTPGHRLAEAVTAVHRGQAVIEPEVLPYVVRGLRGAGKDETTPAGTQRLTRAERELLCLVAQGLTDQEIAAHLFISPRTVQSHLTGIRNKVGLRSRVELTRWALEHSIT